MKDSADNKTMDLLLPQQQTRLQRFRDAQRAAGRVRRDIWLTEAEARAVDALLASMRADKAG